MYDMKDADCHFGDHSWNGSSVCTNCGERLRCQFCGALVREDNEDHFSDSSPKFCKQLRGIIELEAVRSAEATVAPLNQGDN